MHELVSILRSHGIDISSLQRLNDGGQEPIYYFGVPGSDAVALWHKLRGLVDHTGHWPVLLGDDKELEDHREALADEHYPATQEMLEAAEAIDAESWLKDALADMFEPDDDYTRDDLRGEWPSNAEPQHEFSIPYDRRTGRPYPTIHIGLVPTTLGWQVPALLHFGAWNDCPKPEEHVSVLKRWEQRYGAELVGVTHDTIEMLVARPPRTRDDALALAYEQVAYCPDIVDQGAGTLDALAAVLVNGSVWFFWWD